MLQPSPWRVNLPQAKRGTEFDRLQVDGVHEAGERDPGDGTHEQQVILPGLVLQGGMLFDVVNPLSGIGGKDGEVWGVGYRAEAEQVVLREDGRRGVDDIVLHHLLAADAPAELGQLVGHAGDEVDDGYGGGYAPIPDGGQEFA